MGDELRDMLGRTVVPRALDDRVAGEERQRANHFEQGVHELEHANLSLRKADKQLRARIAELEARNVELCDSNGVLSSRVAELAATVERVRGIANDIRSLNLCAGWDIADDINTALTPEPPR